MVFVNTEAQILEETCQAISDIVRARFGDDTMSARLKCMLQRTVEFGLVRLEHVRIDAHGIADTKPLDIVVGHGFGPCTARR